MFGFIRSRRRSTRNSRQIIQQALTQALAPAMMEALEERRLLAACLESPYATFVSGAMTLNGTGGADTVTLSTDVSGKVLVTHNGTPYNVCVSGTPVNSADVQSIVINGGDQNDTLNFSGVTTANGYTHSSLPGHITLNGDAGNDTFIGSPFADSISGGTGTDTADYSARTSALTLLLDGTASSSDGDTLGSDIENAIGGTGNDIITGNSSANSLTGGAGNDSLTGNAGDDTLVGGDGDDTYQGGIGADTYSDTSTTSNDTYVFSGSADLGTDPIDDNGGTSDTGDFSGLSSSLRLNFTLTPESPKSMVYDSGTTVYLKLTGGNPNTQFEKIIGGPGNDSVTGTNSNETLVGNGGNDTLDGSGGNDSLDGSAGTDSITGGAGNDILIGGADNDSLDGGSNDDRYVFSGSTTLGTDQINESASSGTDTIDLSGMGGTAGAKLDLTIIGSNQTVVSSLLTLNLSTSDAVEYISGTANGDTLTGNSTANSLSGNGGNDILIGGVGNDTLDGGTGSDTASYETNSSGQHNRG
jgi:Ca2+-binding RTX toxin-like protein